jgi:hypothetical protein
MVVVVTGGTVVVVEGTVVVVDANVVVVSGANRRVVVGGVAAHAHQPNERIPNNTPPASTTRNLNTGVVTAPERLNPGPG